MAYFAGLNWLGSLGSAYFSLLAGQGAFAIFWHLPTLQERIHYRFKPCLATCVLNIAPKYCEELKLKSLFLILPSLIFLVVRELIGNMATAYATKANRVPLQSPRNQTNLEYS